MRRKRDTQGWFEFQESNLKVTNEYFAKYGAISSWLDKTPEILDLVHRDTRSALSSVNAAARRCRARFKYTSEHVLRICIAQVIEGVSLRGIVVRVDDSRSLRVFTRIYDGPMMDFTTFDRIRNAIQPATWKKINNVLARSAANEGTIDGDRLRIDTTAVETNIHYPTDSSLLWDSYRVLARLIESARDVDRSAVGMRRLHCKRVKGLHRRIGTITRRGRKPDELKIRYSELIRSVEGICEWASDLSGKLARRARSGRYGAERSGWAESLAEELDRYQGLARRVVSQTRQRVIEDRSVANKDKLLSVFEPHTELIKRGKAGKFFEYGHMIQVQQVDGCFITDYEVFSKKPNESLLLPAAIESHKRLFGAPPAELAADRGYWPGKDALDDIEDEVELVSVGKNGRPNGHDRQREADPLFRHAQRFRAGVEGTISFLKRVLGLARCFNKGWRNYVSTIGASLFAHNLLVLARC